MRDLVCPSASTCAARGSAGALASHRPSPHLDGRGLVARSVHVALQETGGTKTGKLAIPVGPMAQTQTASSPKSQWPGRVMAKKNVFYRAGAVFERRTKNASWPCTCCANSRRSSRVWHGRHRAAWRWRCRWAGTSGRWIASEHGRCAKELCAAGITVRLTHLTHLTGPPGLSKRGAARSATLA